MYIYRTHKFTPAYSPQPIRHSLFATAYSPQPIVNLNSVGPQQISNNHSGLVGVAAGTKITRV